MIVVDASIAVKWILANEEYEERALLIYQNHITQKEKIIIPSLLFIEVANSLVTKSATSISIIKKALVFLYNAHFQIYEPNYDDVMEAMLGAKKYKTTVYDMLYLVVAKKHKTVLVTADERFVARTEFPFVKLISEI